MLIYIVRDSRWQENQNSDCYRSNFPWWLPQTMDAGVMEHIQIFAASDLERKAVCSHSQIGSQAEIGKLKRLTLR